MTSESQNQRMLIVGAGQAASEVAISLRQKGYRGHLLMLGDESHLPYQRPPLSKAYLSGEAEPSSLLLKPAAAYEKLGIEIRAGARVTRIEPETKKVELADGTACPYDKLILATGGRPRLLPLSTTSRTGKQPTNVHYLRTIDDVNRIREQLKPHLRLIVIGGGYVGLEVAAVALQLRLKVTVIESLPRVLARVTAPEVSAFYEAVHRAAGVEIRTGIRIEALDLDQSGDAVKAIVCADGTVIPADVVIVGVGLVPNIELAEQAGLEIDNGIAVDESCRTSHPDIYAIGDCASRTSALYGKRIRLESVPSALEQARALACELVGLPRPQEAVPWFWSDQYDLKLQMVGLSEGYDRLVIRGAPSAREFIAFYLRDRRLIAADAINVPSAFMFVKRIAGKQPVVEDCDALADTAVPLQSLFSAGA